MKTINQKITESKNTVKYSVSFIGNKSTAGGPIDATILVDKADAKEFEKYLEDEQDNIFQHAEGGDVEY